ncbi:MAG: hypothetical protein Q4A11_01270 [Brachymonas sp.]|nr:hypothetical protein [Brachymonas sp.]
MVEWQITSTKDVRDRERYQIDRADERYSHPMCICSLHPCVPEYVAEEIMALLMKRMKDRLAARPGRRER